MFFQRFALLSPIATYCNTSVQNPNGIRHKNYPLRSKLHIPIFTKISIFCRMRLKSTLLFLACICLFSVQLFAQNGVLRGNISNENTGEPLIGATVFIIGTYKGGLTDDKGNFNITGYQSRRLFGPPLPMWDLQKKSITVSASLQMESKRWMYAW